MFRSIIGIAALAAGCGSRAGLYFCRRAPRRPRTRAASPSRDEVRESVVRIEVEHAQGTRQGTGFIINDNRTIATNNHVIEGAKAIWVTFLANGKPTSIPGRLIATDPVKDMALIETVSDIFGEPIVMADYDTNPPAKVTAIGYPVAADFVAGGLLPTIMLEPSYSVGTVARIVSNAKMLGGATSHPAHRRRQSRQQRRPAVRRVRPRHRHQHAAHAAEGVRLRAGHLLRRRHPRAAHDARRERHQVDQERPSRARRASTPRTTSSRRPTRQPKRRCSTASRPASRRGPAIATCARPATPTASAARWRRAGRSDIDIRMNASQDRCTEQKEAEAYGEFQRCSMQQPCEFEKTCGPKLEEALAVGSMKERRTIFDRARTKAVADCKTANAPGVWRGAETETGIWLAAVYERERCRRSACAATFPARRLEAAVSFSAP